MAFDWPDVRGPKPLLVVLEESISATYSGGGTQLPERQCVEIWPLHGQTLTGTFQLARNGVASGSISVSATGPAFATAVTSLLGSVTVTQDYDHLLPLFGYDQSIRRWCITWTVSYATAWCASYQINPLCVGHQPMYRSHHIHVDYFCMSCIGSHRRPASTYHRILQRVRELFRICYFS